MKSKVYLCESYALGLRVFLDQLFTEQTWLQSPAWVVEEWVVAWAGRKGPRRGPAAPYTNFQSILQISAPSQHFAFRGTWHFDFQRPSVVIQWQLLAFLQQFCYQFSLLNQLPHRPVFFFILRNSADTSYCSVVNYLDFFVIVSLCTFKFFYSQFWKKSREKCMCSTCLVNNKPQVLDWFYIVQDFTSV